MTENNPAQIGSEPALNQRNTIRWTASESPHVVTVSSAGATYSPGQFKTIYSVNVQGSGGVYEGPVFQEAKPSLAGYERPYSLSELEAAQEFIDQCQG